MYELDVRGLSCPEPLMLTRDALKKQGTPVKVLVDGATAKNNIEKLIKKEGKKLTINDLGGEWEMIIE